MADINREEWQSANPGQRCQAADDRMQPVPLLLELSYSRGEARCTEYKDWSESCQWRAVGVAVDARAGALRKASLLP